VAVPARRAGDALEAHVGAGGLPAGPALYCAIEFMDGMRKQVFLLFPILVLAKEYNEPAQTVALLMFGGQVLALLAAPMAGMLTDRWGERAGLRLYFSGVGVTFLLFAVAQSLSFFFIIYIVTSGLLSFRVGLTTYAGRVAGKHERTQLLALGGAANHIGAVILPLVGGALYGWIGWRLPFLCGVVVTLFALVLTPVHPPRTENMPASV